MDEERLKATESGMVFFDLLVMLRELVRLQLGLSGDPVSGEAHVDLAAARRIMDMIIVLHEKTESNLTVQEEQVLSNLIAELQVAIIRAENRVGKRPQTEDEENIPKGENGKD